MVETGDIYYLGLRYNQTSYVNEAISDINYILCSLNSSKVNLVKINKESYYSNVVKELSDQ